MSLEYPFGEKFPEFGEIIEICPDVKWVRTPLPIDLNHINCYLIKDGDGWAIVDTGMNTEAGRDSWKDIIENQLEGGITRVFVTHQHPDHVGLAGWLCATYRVPLFITEGEFLYSQMFFHQSQSDGYWEVEQFFDRVGMDEETRKGLMAETDFLDSVSKLPPTFNRVVDGEKVMIGEHFWTPIITRGHSPQHLSLYCEDLDLLISGDQVLPRITSNVSILVVGQHESPLRHWYEAHDRIEKEVPDSVTVLPAHERIFKGLHERLDDVIAHHEDRLARILEICEEAHTVQALSTKLFNRKMDVFQNYLALGEALAHLHLLMEQGKIERFIEQDIYRFRSLQA